MGQTKAKGRVGFAAKGSLVTTKQLNQWIERVIQPLKDRVGALDRERERLQEQLDEAGRWSQELEGRIRRIESTWYRRLWRWLTRQESPYGEEGSDT